ncbi:GL19642 [Drosophila persimilis]|uniref:GL19642 n=1 Tax=Drosophila persimilis TaxID=7234 RepID=B4G7Q2_DROPE|nr:GL19642 [Drosophila persimilis]
MSIAKRPKTSQMAPSVRRNEASRRVNQFNVRAAKWRKVERNKYLTEVFEAFINDTPEPREKLSKFCDTKLSQ